MQIFGASSHLPANSGPFCAGIGIFDGVHLGHRQLLAKVRELAAAEHVGSLAYTFDPHPAKVLSPHQAPKLIEPLHDRLERLAALGLDATLIEPFDGEFAALSARAFVQSVLVEKLNVRHVVVGTNFTFGHKAAGNARLLGELGRQFGFGVHGLDLVQTGTLPISSTSIRTLVDRGDVDQARGLLGRNFAIYGAVVRGARRGTAIGVPTANIIAENELLPKTGIYATLATGQFGQDLPSVTNIGYSPTFGKNPLRIETYVMDRQLPPLYGQTVAVAFVKRLREELRFDGVDALVAQIQKDIADARAELSLAHAV